MSIEHARQWMEANIPELCQPEWLEAVVREEENVVTFRADLVRSWIYKAYNAGQVSVMPQYEAALAKVSQLEKLPPFTVNVNMPGFWTWLMSRRKK